jgi:hypothetical protein
MIKIVLATAVCVYLLIVVLVFFFQARMVFFPHSELEADPSSVGLAYEEVWMTASDGVRLHGWFVPASEGRGVALFCHGNAGNVSHRMETLQALHGLGLSCLIFDYRGYGKSGGSPTELGLYRDAEAAWDWLVGSKGIEPSRIICWGRSLGGPVAARLARDRAPGALVLESTFTTLLELGRKLYPYLPIGLVSRFRFPTRRFVREASSPVLVVHSSEDDLVPIAFGRRVYEAAPEPKSFLTIRGGHGEGFLVSGELYTRGVQDFLRQHGLVS